MAFRDIPVRSKLMVSILLTSVVVMLLMGASFLVYEFLTIRQVTARQLATLGEIIAVNSTAALAFDNQEDAQEILAALKAEGHIVAAAMYDESGRLFSRYPPTLPSEEVPAAPGPAGYHFAGSYLAGFQPVLQKDRRLGSLYLKFDTGSVMRAWFWDSLRIALVVMMAVLLVAYVLSRLLQRQVSQPILSLAETARDISRRRDFSVRAQKHGHDEIGQLTDGFNQVLSGIQERERALQNANEALHIENTERRHAEERAVWLASFPERNPNPIVELDLTTGVIHYANPSAIRAFPDVQARGLGHPLLAGLRDSARGLLSGNAETLHREVVVGDLSFSQTLNYIGETRRLRVYSTDISERRQAEEQTKRLLVDAEKSRRALLGMLEDQQRAEEAIRQLNADLDLRVTERTAQLQAANKELEAFSYTVSHDLRAPLRSMDGFSQAVLEDFGPQLPAEGQRYLHTIRESAQRMGELIDDLLTFARLGRQALNKQAVAVDALVRASLEDLAPQRQGRQIEIRLGDLPACNGDPALLKQVWLNLLSNALKYTRMRESALVEVGCIRKNSQNVYYVRDNGSGFDMQYVHKLFGVFQRLHRAEDYEGTGVGLAIVQRIVDRHGGRVWAEAAIDRGATFYFTLDEEPES